jgi:hypothetical protein
MRVCVNQLALGKDDRGHDIVVTNGHTYRVHGASHRKGAYVYALGHRVYGSCRRSYNAQLGRHESISFEPIGKWAFILNAVVNVTTEQTAAATA